MTAGQWPHRIHSNWVTLDHEGPRKHRVPLTSAVSQIEKASPLLCPKSHLPHSGYAYTQVDLSLVVSVRGSRSMVLHILTARSRLGGSPCLVLPTTDKCFTVEDRTGRLEKHILLSSDNSNLQIQALCMIGSTCCCFRSWFSSFQGALGWKNVFFLLPCYWLRHLW